MSYTCGLQVKILDGRIGKEFDLPRYATPGASALDIVACLNESLILFPQEAHIIKTGIAIHISDPWLTGMILPRSGLGHNHGIIMGNGIGLIDSDYTGELLVSCWNRGYAPYVIHPGDRIAQLVIVHISRPGIQLVDEFATTKRGAGGFGSTGRA